jgi:hypothetical protein
MRPAIALLLFIAISITSGEHKKGSFYATPVPGWRIDSSKIQGDQRLKMRAPEHLGAASGRAIAITVEETDFGVNVFRKKVEEAVKESMFVFEKRSEGHVHINGEEFVWSHTAMKQSRISPLVEQRIYYLQKNGNIYMIICSALEDGLDPMQPEIDGVLNSFKVL